MRNGRGGSAARALPPGRRPRDLSGTREIATANIARSRAVCGAESGFWAGGVGESLCKISSPRCRVAPFSYQRYHSPKTASAWLRIITAKKKKFTGGLCYPPDVLSGHRRTVLAWPPAGSCELVDLK